MTVKREYTLNEYLFISLILFSYTLREYNSHIVSFHDWACTKQIQNAFTCRHDTKQPMLTQLWDIIPQSEAIRGLQT